MSRLYGPQNLSLQDSFGTRQLAERIEALACKTEFDEDAKGFIESLDMFFLTTIDHRGRPTVSYKGGDKGFVRIIDASTLVFPSYDGNGMFLSMGNATANPEIGMLFISFSHPHRLRLQGSASVSSDDPLMADYAGADFIVRVQLSELWQNCPRYVHRYEKTRPSRYVPRAGTQTPLAEWKRVDLVQDVLPEADARRVEEVGSISIETWIEKIKSGDPTA